MLKISQTIIVEGKYDKARLVSVVDADILVTDGFRIFRDHQLLDTIRRLAKKNGIIILTDSDAAGFRIRSYLAGAVEPSLVTHVYIPDLQGKERRKVRPGAEGKLGVEGIPVETLRMAFARAGIVGEDNEIKKADKQEEMVTNLDFLEWGLAGAQNSAVLRRIVLEHLQFPTRLNVKSMLAMINALYGKKEFLDILEQIMLKKEETFDKAEQ